MNHSNNSVTIKIMEREYNVKCPAEKLADLQDAGHYLDEKMREVRNSSKGISADRVAVIAALNIVNELLTQKQQQNEYITALGERIDVLQQKIDAALGEPTQSTQDAATEV